MDDISSQQKSTPARRRPGRAEARPSANKAYASENDVATLDSSRFRRAPQTPSKPSYVSPAPGYPSASKRGSRHRDINKAKARNPSTSPDPTQRGFQDTPHDSVSLRPSTGTAFAGATFHASPAPSALPIPSFHAKSSGGTPVHSWARDVAQEPSPATDTDAPTPVRPSHPSSHESPLDFMFCAHREEKEIKCHNETIGQNTTFSGLASPQPSSQSNGNASPSLYSDLQSRRTISKPPSSGLDSFEVPSGAPMGPAFSTPYQERIRAARSSASRPQPSRDRSSPRAVARSTDDSAEALKKFLFFGETSKQTRTVHETPATTAAVESARRSSQSATAKPTRPEVPLSNNIQAMEDDLRRILKLDLTSKPS